MDAVIPDGAFLNWSILDDTGAEIMGASGSNDVMIPLNMIDHEMYPLVRLKLEFRGSLQAMESHCYIRLAVMDKLEQISMAAYRMKIGMKLLYKAAQ